MECFLISGLGPVHLDYYDIQDTVMDPGANLEEFKSIYEIDGTTAYPQNLAYKGIPLLRQSKYVSGALTTVVLSQILSNNNIKHQLLPIANIWEEKPFSYNKLAIVGLSTTFIWSERMFQISIDWINKSFKEYILIVGGQYATLKGKELLERYSEIGYIINGDGEQALPMLIQYLQHKNKLDLTKIPNLIYRTGSQITETFQMEVDLDSLPVVNFKGKCVSIPYSSMRGCPYRCKFCAQSTTSSFRWLSSERVLNDWKMFKEENDIEYINIADPSFFIPHSRIKEILPQLKELGIKWEANLRADTPLNLEDVKQLEEAGCYEVSFGFESMSERTLKAINKGTTPEQNRKMNNIFRYSAIDPLMSFIVGFPGETLEEFKKTFDYLLEEHYGHFSIYVFEMENSTVPIWKERKKYQFELLTQQQQVYAHMGKHWKHCGMDSVQASQLRDHTIKMTRKSKDCKAIFYSWQRNYEWPMIPGITRQENLEIEKLVDQLVFLSKDYSSGNEQKNELGRIVDELKKYGISVS